MRERNGIARKRAFSSSILIIMFTFILIRFSREETQADVMTETWIDSQYCEWIEELGHEYGISVELITAIVERESSGQPNAFNPNGGSIGLMQVIPTWQGERMKRLGVTNLWDAYSNLLVGIDYLSELIVEYDGNPYKVLMFYNEGYPGIEKAERGEYSDYATSIMRRAYILEELRGKHDYPKPSDYGISTDGGVG